MKVRFNGSKFVCVDCGAWMNVRSDLDMYHPLNIPIPPPLKENPPCFNEGKTFRLPELKLEAVEVKKGINLQ